MTDDETGGDAPLPPEPPAALVPALDPTTLREYFADPAPARTRAAELRTEIAEAPDEVAELIARGDLVDLLRALGEDQDALREALAASDRAELTGSEAQLHTARVRLARVHRRRGEFGDANALYTELLSAATQFGPVVEAYTRQHAGENDLDQGHDEDAAGHFARALHLRSELGLEEAAESRAGLEALRRRGPVAGP